MIAEYTTPMWHHYCIIGTSQLDYPLGFSDPPNPSDVRLKNIHTLSLQEMAETVAAIFVLARAEKSGVHALFHALVTRQIIRG